MADCPHCGKPRATQEIEYSLDDHGDPGYGYCWLDLYEDGCVGEPPAVPCPCDQLAAALAALKAADAVIEHCLNWGWIGEGTAAYVNAMAYRLARGKVTP